MTIIKSSGNETEKNSKYKIHLCGFFFSTFKVFCHFVFVMTLLVLHNLIFEVASTPVVDTVDTEVLYLTEVVALIVG